MEIEQTDDMGIYGKLLYVSVEGFAVNSAQLQFTIEPDNGDKSVTLIAIDDVDKPEEVRTDGASHEIQVFSAMAAFVTAAYFAKEPIGAKYRVLSCSNFATAVFTGKDKKKTHPTKCKEEE